MEPNPKGIDVSNFGFPEGVDINIQVVLTGEQAIEASENPASKLLVTILDLPEFSRPNSPGYIAVHEYADGINSTLRFIRQLATNDTPRTYVENRVVDSGPPTSAMYLGTILNALDLTNQFERKASAATLSQAFKAGLKQGNVDADLLEDGRPEIEAFVNYYKQFFFSTAICNSLGVDYRDLGDVESLLEDNNLGDFFEDIISGVREDGDIMPLGKLMFELSYLKDQDFARYHLRGNKTQKKAAGFAKRVSKTFWELRDRMRTVLLDPDDPQHPLLRQKVIDVFGGDDESMYFASSYFSNGTAFKGLYADTYDAMQKSGDTELYQGIIDMILRSIESGESDPSIVLIDDVESIVTDQEFSEIRSDNQEATINSIISNSSKKTFELDPQEIEWTGIVPPKNVTLQFDKDHPYNYEYTLEYDNEFGEELILTVRVDARSMNLDWNILQSPQEAVRLAAEFLSVGGKLLEQIESETSKIYELRHQEVALVAPTPKRKPRKSRGGKNPHPPHQMQKPRELEIEVVTNQRKDMPRRIILPDDKTLARMTGSFSTVDAQNILNGVSDFNERGVGSFKRLKINSNRRAKLYSLRVKRDSGGGGIRVLIQETESQDGERLFEVVDIQLRNKIYDREKFWE